VSLQEFIIAPKIHEAITAYPNLQCEVANWRFGKWPGTRTKSNCIITATAPIAPVLLTAIELYECHVIGYLHFPLRHLEIYSRSAGVWS